MMRDVMQSAGLTSYAEVGLVILFATFVFVAVRALFQRRGYYDDVAHLPLEADEAGTVDTGSSREV